MTQLLVSVRSASEAEAALRGGAALIDIKEPAKGSLGRASDNVIEDVVRVVAGRRPVSAAMGEFVDTFADAMPVCRNSLRYLKWGLSRFENCDEDIWHAELEILIHHLADRQPTARVVPVAYADWQRASAIKPIQVCAFAAVHPVGAFLIDTWRKDGSTLLDWLSVDEIEHLLAVCRSSGVPMAVAGSLGPAEIQTLLPMRPDWFAVRGVVCQGRMREAAIDEDAVRRLAATLR
jgi:uncharacterized protein (UPF0264 family)